jgi:hypothetical protein
MARPESRPAGPTGRYLLDHIRVGRTGVDGGQYYNGGKKEDREWYYFSLAWCPNVFPTPRIHPFGVATKEDPKEAYTFQITNNRNHNVIPLYSPVCFRHFCFFLVIVAVFAIIIGSSWPYEMTSDMTFAPFVPSAEFTMPALMSASTHATPKSTVRASGSTTRRDPSTPPTRRLLPVQHDLTTPRARARAARLRANEAAERREDMAALVTTPVSHLSLFRSFVTRQWMQYDHKSSPYYLVTILGHI